MKSSSNKYPEIVVKSNGKTQIRYNVLKVTKDTSEGPIVIFEFDYVNVEGELTKGKIINAIIESIYTKDAEIALINDEISNPGTFEYKEYQLFRTKAKEIYNNLI